MYNFYTVLVEWNEKRAKEVRNSQKIFYNFVSCAFFDSIDYSFIYILL